MRQCYAICMDKSFMFKANKYKHISSITEWIVLHGDIWITATWHYLSLSSFLFVMISLFMQVNETMHLHFAKHNLSIHWLVTDNNINR